jgi:hypothetical protein
VAKGLPALLRVGEGGERAVAAAGGLHEGSRKRERRALFPMKNRISART